MDTQNKVSLLQLLIITSLFLLYRPQQENVYWIWDRKDSVTNIQPLPDAVAPLLCTIRLGNKGMLIEPRHHPYVVAKNIPIIGVIRLETSKKSDFLYSDLDIIYQITMVVSNYQYSYKLNEIQLDFDAAKSERYFYTKLLESIRKALPSTTKLSITGLASWFAYDRWWQELPVDEIVFMLYHLTPVEKNIYMVPC